MGAICDAKGMVVKVVEGKCNYNACPTARLIVGRRPNVGINGDTITGCEALRVQSEKAQKLTEKQWPEIMARVAKEPQPEVTEFEW